MPKGWLVPEVVQTSAMDCGPASLKSLVEGFGIPISYDRLREACQTDIDGTSIDTLEEIANQIGLDAEQIMVPLDHVLLADDGSLIKRLTDPCSRSARALRLASAHAGRKQSDVPRHRHALSCNQQRTCRT